MESLPISNPYTGIMSKFSSSFQQFIKDIADAKSKTEEDRILRQDLVYLKEVLLKGDIPSKELKECIVRLIHCDMLGHDVSFAYMEIVKFAGRQNLMEKRVAYVALSLFLSEKNDVERMMNMCSIQKALVNSNLIEVCVGLSAASKLVNKDMLPAILQNVVQLTKHPSPLVRKRAIIALLKFYEIDEERVKSVEHIVVFGNALCDTDPMVMSVSLNAYLRLISEDAVSFKRLTPSFVEIWRQVLGRKLPEDLNYRGVPAPWIQIKVLQILAMLGSDDMEMSKQIYEVLKQCLESTDTEQTIGCAVIYECIKTITTIYPNRALVEVAANKAGLFVVSKNKNLKYLGIIALSKLIHIDVSFATKHQMDVIECLDDPDDSLKRKTLDLLYRMTNSLNVKVICDKLINYLRVTVDEYVKSDLVSKITTLTEKYSPDNEWFIDTMNTVLELGGDLVQVDVAYNMMRILGEGIDDDDEEEEATDDLRRNAVISYTYLLDRYLQEPSLPDVLVQLICWVVGEYVDLIEDYDMEDLIHKLYQLLRKRFVDTITQSWVVTCLTKILGKIKNPSNFIRKVDFNLFTNDATQRYQEMALLFQTYSYRIEDVLPYDASCEDIEIDASLSFLDDYVNKALQQGASPYTPELKQRTEEDDYPEEPGLNFTKYERQVPVTPPPVDVSSVLTGGSTVSPSPSSGGRSSGSNKSLPWTLDGYAKKQQMANESPGSDVSSNDTSSVNTPKSQDPPKHTVESPRHDDMDFGFASRPDPKKDLANQLFVTEASRPSDGIKTKKKGSKENKARKFVPKSQLKTLIDLDASDSAVPEANEEPSMVLKNTSEGSLVNVDQVLTISETEKDDLFKDMNITDASNLATSDDNLCRLQDAMIPDSKESGQFGLLDVDLNDSNIKVTQQEHHTVTYVETTVENFNKLSIPDELSQYECSAKQEQLCTDNKIRLSCQYVYKPIELAIIFHITNQSTQTLTDFNVMFKLPSNLRCNSEGAKWVVQFLEPMQSACHIMYVSYQSPAMHMVLSGQMLYVDSTKTENKLFISHVLPMSVLLRKSQISTEEFQSEWQNRSLYEKKEKINGAQAMNDFTEYLQLVNIHPVQVIDNEVICVTSVLTKHKILLHFKLSSVVDVWIKSNSKLLNESVMKLLTAIK